MYGYQCRSVDCMTIFYFISIIWRVYSEICAGYLYSRSPMIITRVQFLLFYPMSPPPSLEQSVSSMNVPQQQNWQLSKVQGYFFLMLLLLPVSLDSSKGSVYLQKTSECFCVFFKVVFAGLNIIARRETLNC